MRSATSHQPTGAFGNRLRRIASTLSASSQSAVMSDFVARFFSGNAAASSTAGAAGPKISVVPAASVAASTTATTPAAAEQFSNITAADPPECDDERSSSVGRSYSNDERSAAPDILMNNNNQRNRRVGAGAGGGAGGEATTTTTTIKNSLMEDLVGSEEGTSAGARGGDDGDHNDLGRPLNSSKSPRKVPKEPKEENILKILDNVIGSQIADQPDEDVITIVVRNQGAEKRLYEYLVCNEMWFLPLFGADPSSLSDEDWHQIRGARIAIDSLIKHQQQHNVEAADDEGTTSSSLSQPPRQQLCISQKEDLAVYYMPKWEHGVGTTLEGLRKSIQSRPQAAPHVPDCSDDVFSPQTSSDVLSVPFEPNGMRIVLPNGEHELHAMSLHALSDKRQATEPIDPELGQIVAGRFRIDQKVGSATFSDAYAVTLTTGEHGVIDEETAPVACIKVIKPEFFDQALDEVRLLNGINELAQQRYDAAIQLINEFTASNPEAAERGSHDPRSLPVEVQDAIRTSYYECGADASHVVRLADAFYFRHRMFVVTELLKENLYETTCSVVNTEPYWFSVPRLAMIAKQVTSALELLHSLSLIHCDVKPENIMVQSHSRCRVKLIDFGSSSYLHERFSSYVQSRSYRAPEVVMGAPYDSRVDVWSLGAVMVELASRGEILFRSTTLANMMARIAAVCGPMPPTLAHAGYHADCVATRSGIFFSTTSELDDERFEKFDQHPYFYTAQTIASKAEERAQRRAEIEAVNGGDRAAAAAEVESDDDDEAGDAADVVDYDDPTIKREIWLHFPVYQSLDGSSNGGEQQNSMMSRQELWKKKRSGSRSADWVDIYEPAGRIEALLEQNGLWDLPSIVAQQHGGSDDETVAPELLFLDFVKKCLIVEPTERPTTVELLKHPFILYGNAQEDELLHSASFAPAGDTTSATDAAAAASSSSPTAATAGVGGEGGQAGEEASPSAQVYDDEDFEEEGDHF